MFLAWGLEIPNLLSLNVNLHHCIFFWFIDYNTKLWPQSLIETKNENYFKFYTWMQWPFKTSMSSPLKIG